MKISIAQIESVKSNIPINAEKHMRLIELASSLNTSCIFFPELSLTGYEPKQAKHWAMTPDDSRLDGFQSISEKRKISIALGIPTKSKKGIHISMLVFHPHKTRQTYSKQLLHPDERPYFRNGSQQEVLEFGNKKIVPAICYESLQPQHAENASKLGAHMYLASVAKSKDGVAKAQPYFADVAKKHSMPVLMANCVGFCDDFLSAGCSSAWTRKGLLAAQLDERSEGIITFDTETEEAIVQTT